MGAKIVNPSCKKQNMGTKLLTPVTIKNTVKKIVEIEPKENSKSRENIAYTKVKTRLKTFSSIKSFGVVIVSP